MTTWLQRPPGPHAEANYYFAKDPNKPPFFPPWLTALLRFVRYPQATACAECGKRVPSRVALWTMVCPFRASDMKKYKYKLQMGEPLQAYTPVCGDHLLEPLLPENREKQKQKAKK